MIVWGGGPMALRGQRLITRSILRPGTLTKHGRVVRAGQIWRSNDPRRLRGVRVLDVALVPKRQAITQDIVSGRVRTVLLRNFTIGRDGWSLDQEAWS